MSYFIDKCEYCGQDPELVDSCTLDRIEINGEIRPRIPYTQPFFDERYKHCHDCGVTNGNFHHPGCDMETCMGCVIGQLISCSCDINLEGVKVYDIIEKYMGRKI